MIENLPMSAAFLNPAALPSKRKSMYAKLFDRLGQGSGERLEDDQKESLIRQGLLNMGVGMLQTKGQGFGGALGAGLQSGLLAVNQGAQDIGNTRYKNEILARTRQGMERNSEMERAQQGLFNSDGTLNQEKYGEFIQKFPMEALDIKSKATPKAQNDWSLGKIGDGTGGGVDVWINKDTRELRDLTGNPIGGDGFLSGATVDAPQGQQMPRGGFLGADALPALEQAVMQVESGGNPNAVSSAGALGTMQTMPSTLTDPGFGVAPARDRSPAEMERVGKDFLRAMLNKYGDPRLALAAYNWGPGNVDSALKQGGGVEAVLARAPAETRAYVPKVLSQLEGGSAPSPMQRRLGYWPAKTSQSQEEYRTMTPAEVKDLGLPVGTVAQRSPTGQVQIINKPRDLPAGGQVIENEDGSTTYIPAGKTSVDEKKAAGFYERMVSADKMLSDPTLAGYDPTNPSDRAAIAMADRGGVTGGLANSRISPQGQRYRNAAMNWIRANLRKESGAVIGIDEARAEYENYFPVYGDSQAVIDQKEKQRKVVEQAMRTAAGGALPPSGQQAPKRAPKTPPGWSIQRVD